MWRWALAALALAGCDAGSSGPAVQTLALNGGAVQAVGPERFCAAPALSRPADGFAIFVGCNRLDAGAVPPLRAGLISVQVGDAGSAIVTGRDRALRDVMRGPEGQALLAGENHPRTIDIDTVTARDGIVFVHLTDSAPPLVAGLDGQEWRAFFDLQDRLVTIGVRGFEQPPLTRSDGLQLLREAVDELRRANEPASGEVDLP